MKLNIIFQFPLKLAVKKLFLLFKQAKLKEEREAKRNSLDDRHAHLFQIVADRLGLDKNEVEDFVLEGNQVNML